MKSTLFEQVFGRAAAAVWLAVAPLLLCAPVAGAAGVLRTTDVKKQFSPGKTLKMDRNARGWVFRLDGCPCIALPDASGIVRYIFILLPEKEERGENDQNRAQEVAEQLVEFLHKENHNQATMVPFDGRNGFAVSISHSSDGNTVCDIATYKALANLLERGGVICGLKDGEIDVKVPCARVDGDTCRIGLPFLKTNTGVISFVPGRSSRSTDKKVIEAAKENLSCSDLAAVSIDEARKLKRETGANRVIADGSDLCLVRHNRRCYIGAKGEIKDYLSVKKRGAAPPIDFPKESGSLAAESKAVKEDAPTSANAICRYLCNGTPVVSDDCVHIRMKGCRILIPLPDRNDSGRAEAIRNIYVRSDSGDGENSRRYAEMLIEMLLGSKTSAKISTFKQNNSAAKITFQSGTVTTVIESDDIAKLLTGADFADEVVHPWPERTRKGAAISPEFRILYDPESAQKQAAKEDAGSKNVPASPDQALKDYIEYLRRLKK